MKKRNNKKKNTQSNFSKLSIFQNHKYKLKKKCPLSGKEAPIVPNFWTFSNRITFITLVLNYELF